MADQPLKYDYSEGTLRGTVARIIQARAVAQMEEQNAELGTEHALDVPLLQVGRMLEDDERTYERMCDVLDQYFSDWSSEIAEELGLIEE